MQEFMCLIYTTGDHMAAMSPEDQQQHIEKVGAYLQQLAADGVVKSAQPLAMEGTVVQGGDGMVHDVPFTEAKEVIGGYYHIVADNLQQAVTIVRKDPRFEEDYWKIEIRPISVVPGIND